ncbi:MAG: hypothetical protein V3T17_10350 [Pseudomonadales bacterium]
MPSFDIISEVDAYAYAFTNAVDQGGRIIATRLDHDAVTASSLDPLI